MKPHFPWFLFQKRPADGLSPRQRKAFWAWNALLLAGGAAALGMLSLVLAPGPYGWEVFFDYLRHPVLLLLNLLPPVALSVLAYGITGRAWPAYLITALPVLGLSFGSYYKLFFRDDPVIASDLLILAEAGQMAGQYELFLSAKLAAVLVCAALGFAAVLLLARGRPGRSARVKLAAGPLIAAVLFTPVYAFDKVYDSIKNYDHVERWSTTQQYVSRGLLYPFLHSVKEALPDPPPGYSEREAAALLGEYEDAVIPADRRVNIVGVMLEAFSDFSVFDEIEFQYDAYALYHALEAESYSGRLLTNIFAGGTINTERAFLTGMAPSNINYRTDTSSYVWYLKSQGYRASGDHPSNYWFYNRANVNRFLGFDSYRFKEDHYGALSPSGGGVFDEVFFPELTRSVLEQAGDDAPLFSFSVSYQGHGPYDDSVCWWGQVDDFIANFDLSQEDRTILANYLGSVISTQRYLCEMVDAFRESGEPIVLVVFGDHKPWLGNKHAVYEALGINLDQDTEDGFYNYWSTSYLIWANDAAKEALGRSLVGKGPDIASCFLMNLLFDQLGWEGSAYMQAVRECWREMPVIHPSDAYVTADGQLLRALSKEQEELVLRFRRLEYYRAHHFSS